MQQQQYSKSSPLKKRKQITPSVELDSSRSVESIYMERKKSDRIAFLQNKNSWFSGEELFYYFNFDEGPSGGFDSFGTNFHLYLCLVLDDININMSNIKRTKEMYEFLIKHCSPSEKRMLKDWKPKYFYLLNDEERKKYFSKEYLLEKKLEDEEGVEILKKLSEVK